MNNMVVVNSFYENENGNLEVKIARAAQDRADAVRIARTMALSEIGVIAFERLVVDGRMGMDIFYREGRIPTACM